MKGILNYFRNILKKEEKTAVMDTKLGPNEVEGLQAEVGCLHELCEAGRILVLPESLSVNELFNLLDEVSRQDNNSAETYTRSYKNGQAELLRRILGISDGTRCKEGTGE